MAQDPGKKGVIKLIIERTRSERVKKDYRKHIQEKIKPSELQRMRHVKTWLEKRMKEQDSKKNKNGWAKNPFKIT